MCAFFAVVVGLIRSFFCLVFGVDFGVGFFCGADNCCLCWLVVVVVLCLLLSCLIV